MRCFRRAQIKGVRLPGRTIQSAVGKDAFSASEEMTIGFGLYSAESGPMEPHQHAEEVLYVVDAQDAWARCGPEKDDLGERIPLETGMILHNPPSEWHVFEHGEGGHIDLLFIYGQVDDIRPEDLADK